MFLLDAAMAIEISGAIVGYGLEQSGLGSRIRTQFRPKDELDRKAKAEALGRAIFRAAERVTAENFAFDRVYDVEFLKTDGAPFLGEFLTVDPDLNPSDFAIAWAEFWKRQPWRTDKVKAHDLEAIALDFFEALGDELHGESELADLANAQVLVQIRTELAAIRSVLGAGKATRATEYDYLKWVVDRSRYLNPHVHQKVQEFQRIRLDRVFVELSATPVARPSLDRDRQPKEEEVEEYRRLLVASGREPEEVDEELLRLGEHVRMRPNPTPSGPLFGFVRDNPRLVVLGDPGGGKSTLLQQLALLHAEVFNKWSGGASTELGPFRFPLHLRIAEYANQRRVNVGVTATARRSLLQTFASTFESEGCSPSGLDDLISSNLQAGTCLVLLDGLDEIVSATDRIQIVNEIDLFVRQHVPK